MCILFVHYAFIDGVRACFFISIYHRVYHIAVIFTMFSCLFFSPVGNASECKLQQLLREFWVEEIAWLACCMHGMIHFLVFCYLTYHKENEKQLCHCTSFTRASVNFLYLFWCKNVFFDSTFAYSMLYFLHFTAFGLQLEILHLNFDNKKHDFGEVG